MLPFCSQSFFILICFSKKKIRSIETYNTEFLPPVLYEQEAWSITLGENLHREECYLFEV
jgi:hypothetical protein